MEIFYFNCSSGFRTENKLVLSFPPVIQRQNRNMNNKINNGKRTIIILLLMIISIIILSSVVHAQTRLDERVKGWFGSVFQRAEQSNTVRGAKEIGNNLQVFIGAFIFLFAITNLFVPKDTDQKIVPVRHGYS